MFSSPFLASATLVAVFLYIHRRWKQKSRLENLPMPGGASFLWGHEQLEYRDESAKQFLAWFKEVGKVFKIKGALGHPDILVLGDTLAINHIYVKNTYNYPHSPVFRPFLERLIGRGLVWVEGEREHKRQRSLCAPAFTTENVKAMSPEIYHVTSALREHVAFQLHSAPKSTLEMDMIELIGATTLDLIGRTSFDYDFNAIGGDPYSRTIMREWKKQQGMGMEEAGFAALWILRWFPFLTSMPFPTLKAQCATANMIRPLARVLFARGEHGKKNGKDLLSILLRAYARQDPGKSVGLPEIYDQIVTFVLAGHETSTSVTAFTIYGLARNENVQNKLREELLNYPGEEPSFEDFNNTDVLPYLDAVVKEGLRLWPPSARNEKIAVEDDVIPLRYPVRGMKGIPVKKGQVIHIASIALNRDPEVWGPDSNEFRPTRWLVNRPCAEKYCLDPKVDYGPIKPEDLTTAWSGVFSFSDGPRNCVGMRLALFEVKAILFTLFRDFAFYDTGADVMARQGTTLAPRVREKWAEGVMLPLKVALAN